MDVQANKNATIADIAGNAILFMPTEALVRYSSKLTDDDQYLLEETINVLSKTHPFLGGLVFENNIEKLPTALGIKPEGLKLVSDFMRQHGLELGGLPNYNRRTDLQKIMNTALPKNRGITRRDKYRGHLNKILGNEKEHAKTLSVSDSASQDERENLTISFNLTADLQEKIATAHLTGDEITAAVNGSLKRIIRAAFIKEMEISTPMDDAAIKFDNPLPATISINNNQIDISIALTPMVNGAFTGKILSSEHVEDGLSKEIIHGINLAAALKQAPAHT